METVSKDVRPELYADIIKQEGNMTRMYLGDDEQLFNEAKNNWVEAIFKYRANGGFYLSGYSREDFAEIPEGSESRDSLISLG